MLQDRAEVEDHPAWVFIAKADQTATFVEPRGVGIDGIGNKEAECHRPRLRQLEREPQGLLE